ncbi:MAG: hypothetical protein WCF84_00640 [Anaerolineae bacterium]
MNIKKWVRAVQGVGVLGGLVLLALMVTRASASVTLSSFAAQSGTTSITVTWTTATEINNLGFNLLRSNNATSGFGQINPNLIPGCAGCVNGDSYSYADTTAPSGQTMYYKLQSVSSSGSKQNFGPVSAMMGTAATATPTPSATSTTGPTATRTRVPTGTPPPSATRTTIAPSGTGTATATVATMTPVWTATDLPTEVAFDPGTGDTGDTGDTATPTKFARAANPPAPPRGPSPNTGTATATGAAAESTAPAATLVAALETSTRVASRTRVAARIETNAPAASQPAPAEPGQGPSVLITAGVLFAGLMGVGLVMALGGILFWYLRRYR